jgi:nucleotide-binding universal stress UspA family protein
VSVARAAASSHRAITASSSRSTIPPPPGWRCVHAVGIAHDQHARLTLLTVVPPPPSRVPAAGIEPGALLAEMESEAAARLRALASQAPSDVSLTTIIREGEPAEEMLAALADEPFDLLCMWARGETGWRRRCWAPS